MSGTAPKPRQCSLLDHSGQVCRLTEAAQVYSALPPKADVAQRVALPSNNGVLQGRLKAAVFNDIITGKVMSRDGVRLAE